jgi:hypothetical protein
MSTDWPFSHLVTAQLIQPVHIPSGRTCAAGLPPQKQASDGCRLRQFPDPPVEGGP